MASSNEPYSRQEWNDLVAQINDLAQNPDNGCDPTGTLNVVDECHRLAKDDITAAQNILMQICDENSFSDVSDFWKVSDIQELEDAAGNGWCNCDEDECPYYIGPLHFQIVWTFSTTGPVTHTLLEGMLLGQMLGTFFLDHQSWTLLGPSPPEPPGESDTVIATGGINCLGNISSYNDVRPPQSGTPGSGGNPPASSVFRLRIEQIVQDCVCSQ